MSLRVGVVESIVDALWEQGYSVSDVEAGAALDAILDTLEANAAEWKRIAYAAYPTTDPDEFGAAAIAALRDTETDGE